MKPDVYDALLVVCVLVVLYGAGVFISLEPHFANWSGFGRYMYLLVSAAASFTGFMMRRPFK